jgi:hypothetical protein
VITELRLVTIGSRIGLGYRLRVSNQKEKPIGGLIRRNESIRIDNKIEIILKNEKPRGNVLGVFYKYVIVNILHKYIIFLSACPLSRCRQVVLNYLCPSVKLKIKRNVSDSYLRGIKKRAYRHDHHPGRLGADSA